jgi:hypothetical protein
MNPLSAGAMLKKRLPHSAADLWMNAALALIYVSAALFGIREQRDALALTPQL